LIVIVLGLVFSLNLELGYQVLDLYPKEYLKTFLVESSLLVEVMISITAIFIATVLSSKTNQVLVVFTTENRRQRINFFISRYLAAFLSTFLTIGFAFLSTVILVNCFTPLNIRLAILIDLYAWIFYQAIFLQVMVFFLFAIFNHFLILTVPIVVFWYKKTIVFPSDYFSDLEKVILSFVPSFTLINEYVISYQEGIIYLIGLMVMFMITVLVNVYSDCK
jgi:hypothetical protein